MCCNSIPRIYGGYVSIVKWASYETMPLLLHSLRWRTVAREQLMHHACAFDCTCVSIVSCGYRCTNGIHEPSRRCTLARHTYQLEPAVIRLPCIRVNTVQVLQRQHGFLRFCCRKCDTDTMSPYSAGGYIVVQESCGFQFTHVRHTWQPYCNCI